MHSTPRPPASLSLGGSLRASRAAWLARPEGPLAAVDLADGRALEVVRRGQAWIAPVPGEETLALPAAAPVSVVPRPAPAPARRRRLGAAALLAGALGAAVALAAGLSGSPSPAVAGATAYPRTLRVAPARPLRGRARGGRAATRPLPAVALASPAAPPGAAPPPARPAPPAPVPAPLAPAPPALPELPSAPAL